MYSTFSGLEKWYKHEIEKFGWVIISDDKEKMSHYEDSLKKLSRQLKKSYQIYEEKDRKHDIAVMSKHVDKLLEFWGSMTETESSTTFSE